LSITRRRGIVLAALCALAGLIRAAFAYHGGIWADEGFFLLVVRAPSWSTMLDFLRFHESHPPFFYGLMRLWMSATGGGDAMALLLCVLIGVAIVPAIFIVGRDLFSPRAGLIAAGLAAISPPLIEHSAQLRPYGLMPLLALISCFALATAAAGGGLRRWSLYAGSTALLLYTHNWGWLVAVGQLVAVASLFFFVDVAGRRRLAREWILSWLAIGLVYLPWIPAFVFQARHAGHGPIVIDTFAQWMQLALLGIPAAVMMVVAGHVTDITLDLWVVVAAVGAATTVALSEVPGFLKADARAVHRTEIEPAALSKAAMRVFIIVPVAAILFAVLLSPRSNLLLPRCMATLTPLALLVLGAWLDDVWTSTSHRPITSRFGAGVFTVVAAVSILGARHLLLTERSNSKEVAGILSLNIRAGDLLIIAPEWYAASLNHYLGRSVDEIDYPHPGKSGMIDFSHVFERVSDPAPLTRLRDTINKAAVTGRRVWLVTSSDYARTLRPRDVEDATRFHLASAFSIIRVHQIENALGNAFGPPDLSYLVRGQKRLNDNLLVFLYAPVKTLREPAAIPR
jgi:uncharacterized membrane protein